MKKAIMFDLDGTLIDSLPDIAAAMNRTLARYGLATHSLDAYRYLVGDGVVNLSRRAVGTHQEYTQRVMQDYQQDYAHHCACLTHPYDGIPETLHALRGAGYLIFVFSNKDQADAEQVCAHYFPDFPFDCVRGRQEHIPVKPAPDGAMQILDAFRLSPDDCWYVGDTNTDMRCGANAGMETIGVLWGFRDKEELVESGARHIAASPRALVDHILNSGT